MLPDVPPLRLVEQLLIPMQLKLQQRASQRLFYLALTRAGGWPAREARHTSPYRYFVHSSMSLISAGVRSNKA